MRALLQIATLIALAVDIASTILLYWTTQSAGQDAAGGGMASGLLVFALAVTAAAFLLLLVSYWRSSTGTAWLALIVALVPSVPIVLPALL